MTSRLIPDAKILQLSNSDIWYEVIDVGEDVEIIISKVNQAVRSMSSRKEMSQLGDVPGSVIIR